MRTARKKTKTGMRHTGEDPTVGFVSGFRAELNKEKIRDMRELMHPDVLELEGGDVHVGSVVDRVKAEEKLSAEKQKRPYSFYRDLIFALIGVRLDESRARSDWQAIVGNKKAMSDMLGRNVGVRVAALDYYTNIKRHVARPVMMDADALADTVEHSITDGLTGAYNRRYFDLELQRIFDEARDESSTFCLLLLDVDHFKIYNDANGHITGDLALIEMVRILHAVTRREDTVCRYGGEEFAVIFPKFGLVQARHIADTVRQSFEDFRFHNEDCLPCAQLTVSGGITCYVDGPDIDSLLKEADAALYQAKREGRNRVVCFREIT